MTEIRKVWILPLLSGIIAILSLLTPGSIFIYTLESGSITEIQWMWGLLYYEVKHFSYGIYDSGFQFITHTPVSFFSCVIISNIILACSIISIVSSIIFRKKPLRFTSFKKYWIISGIFQIASGIFWVIAMQIGFLIFKIETIGEVMSYWETRLPNFGVIGPIICGVLCIIAVGIGVRMSKSRDVNATYIPLEKAKSGKDFQSYSDLQMSQTVDPVYLNFCPECGHKIHTQYKKFCSNCGTSLSIK